VQVCLCSLAVAQAVVVLVLAVRSCFRRCCCCEAKKIAACWAWSCTMRNYAITGNYEATEQRYT